MVMPAAPVADFVVGQPRFALGATQTFFDAVFGLGRASELGQRGVGAGVRQRVVGLRDRLLVVIRYRRSSMGTTSGPFGPSSTSTSIHAVIAYIDEQTLTDFTKNTARRHITKNNSHGRKEIRHYIQIPAPKTLPGFEL